MNPNTIHYLNISLGAGAIALQVLALVVLVSLFTKTKKSILLDFLHKHFLSIGFIIAFLAAFFSLIYSEILGFAPCLLCWYQRIFLFPAVFLFAVALWDKDRKVIRYVLPLLSVGFLVALYQNFGYYFGSNSAVICDPSGISCYQHLISEFGGYISIPMLSLTTFFALLVLLLAAHFYKKDIV